MGSRQTNEKKMQSLFFSLYERAKNELEHEEYFSCYVTVAQKFNRIISI